MGVDTMNGHIMAHKASLVNWARVLFSVVALTVAATSGPAVATWTGTFSNNSEEKISVAHRYWYYGPPGYDDGYLGDVPPGGTLKKDIPAGLWSAAGNTWVYKRPGEDEYDGWADLEDDFTFTSTNTAHPNGVNPDPGKANSVDPINTINGNVSVAETDIVVPCPGFWLGFARFYNSRAEQSRTLGPRWSHSLDWYLVAETNLVEYQNTNTYGVLFVGNGEEVWFRKSGSSYQPPLDLAWSLEAQGTNGYEVRLPYGAGLAFDTNGVLESVTNRWGNTLTLTYTNDFPTHLLARAEHENGLDLEFTYTAGGLLSTVTSPSTNLSVAFSYNASGELTNATRSAGSVDNTTTYKYDTSGYSSLTQRVNAAGDVYSYQYLYESAPSGVICKGTNMVLGTNWYAHSVSYPPSTGCVTELVYHDGDRDDEIEYEFNGYLAKVDGTGRIISGQKVTFGLDAHGNTSTEVEKNTANGKYIERRTLHDQFHNVTNAALGYCASADEDWYFSWDTNLQVLTSVTDPEGRKIEFGYTNAYPALMKLYYGESSCYTSSLSYTTNGLLSAVTNANGHWVRFSYDGYGRLAEIDPQAGPTVTVSNDALGHIERMTLPGDVSNRTVTIESDELGRISEITYPDGLSESFVYDAIGNLTNYTDTAGETTSYTYKPTHKLASVTRHGPGTTKFTVEIEYDDQFRVRRVTDAGDRTVEAYGRDSQNRVTSVTNLEGQTMSITYAVGDFVEQVTRFDGTIVSNDYDQGGRLQRMTLTNSTLEFSWLENGLLLTASNEAGTVSNTWNAANRLAASRSAGPTGLVSYTYLPAGQVSNATSVAGTSTYAHDAGERITQIASPEDTFAYTYNTNNGLVASMACSDSGIGASFSYDVVDRLTGITWQDGSTNVLRSFAYGYDSADLITDVVFHDGGYADYTYNFAGRLTSEKLVSGAARTLCDADYAYRDVGNRTIKLLPLATGGMACWYEGGNNRLTSWTTSGCTGTLTGMDVWGCSSETVGTNAALGQLWVSNVLAEAAAASGTNFSLAALTVESGSQNVVAAVRDAAGNVTYVTNAVTVNRAASVTFSLDDAGCMTNVAYNDFSLNVAFLWNDRYQLTAVATNGGVELASYAYDALGRRAYWSDGSSTNWLLYDGVHVLAEVDPAGELLKSYTWGPGIDNLLAFTDYTGGETNTYYCLTDHLGSVHALADEAGDIVESYRYDAWGRVLGVYDADGRPLEESAVGNRYLWQGRWYEWELHVATGGAGVYYFRARWYDPVTGRWLSKDPIGISGGLNQYVFCGNNPVNFVDPFGLRWVDVYVWNGGGFSAGHIMITEHNSEKVRLSQWPTKRWLSTRNTQRSFKHTWRSEGRPPDNVYWVFVPDDAAFDAACADHADRDSWTAFPKAGSETHCARSSYDALQAGGVPLSGYDTGRIFPGNLGSLLQAIATSPIVGPPTVIIKP